MTKEVEGKPGEADVGLVAPETMTMLAAEDRQVAWVQLVGSSVALAGILGTSGWAFLSKGSLPTYLILWAGMGLWFCLRLVVRMVGDPSHLAAGERGLQVRTFTWGPPPAFLDLEIPWTELVRVDQDDEGLTLVRASGPPVRVWTQVFPEAHVKDLAERIEAACPGSVRRPAGRRLQGPGPGGRSGGPPRSDAAPSPGDS